MIIRKGCIKNAIKKIHIKRLKKCDKKYYEKQSYKKLFLIPFCLSVSYHAVSLFFPPSRKNVTIKLSDYLHH